jgi:hypothetical protein
LLGSRNRKAGGIEQPGLNEHRGLIPVDVLVRNLAAFKLHHDYVRQHDLLAGWLDTREREVNDAVMGKRENQFVNHLVLADRPGDALDARVRRHFPHKVVRIEIEDAVITIASGDGRYVVHVRLIGHGLHRRGDVVFDELVAYMRIENGAQIGCA